MTSITQSQCIHEFVSRRRSCSAFRKTTAIAGRPSAAESRSVSGVVVLPVASTTAVHRVHVAAPGHVARVAPGTGERIVLRGLGRFSDAGSAVRAERSAECLPRRRVCRRRRQRALRRRGASGRVEAALADVELLRKSSAGRKQTNVGQDLLDNVPQPGLHVRRRVIELQGSVDESRTMVHLPAV